MAEDARLLKTCVAGLLSIFHFYLLSNANNAFLKIEIFEILSFVVVFYLSTVKPFPLNHKMKNDRLSQSIFLLFLTKKGQETS